MMTVCLGIDRKVADLAQQKVAFYQNFLHFKRIKTENSGSFNLCLCHRSMNIKCIIVISFHYFACVHVLNSKYYTLVCTFIPLVRPEKRNVRKRKLATAEKKSSRVRRRVLPFDYNKQEKGKFFKQFMFPPNVHNICCCQLGYFYHWKLIIQIQETQLSWHQMVISMCFCLSVFK